MSPGLGAVEDLVRELRLQPRFRVKAVLLKVAREFGLSVRVVEMAMPAVGRTEPLSSVAAIARSGLGVSRTTLQAMKLAGFQMEALNKTRVSAVMAWLRARPEFRVGDFYGVEALAPAQLAAKYPEVQARLLVVARPSKGSARSVARGGKSGGR